MPIKKTKATLSMINPKRRLRIAWADLDISLASLVTLVFIQPWEVFQTCGMAPVMAQSTPDLWRRPMDLQML
jgi:hypothetical protein